MTGALAIFYVAGALTLAGALLAVSRREATAAIGGYAMALAGAATIAILLHAPLVAIVLAVASAWGLALLALAARGQADDADADADGHAAEIVRTGARARDRRWTTIGAAIGLALLGWVFVGTWGRQQAFPGHDLAPGASFGGVRELASAAGSELASLWIAAPLLILAAILAGLALADAEEEA